MNQRKLHHTREWSKRIEEREKTQPIRSTSEIRNEIGPGNRTKGKSEYT